jgi:hypothetical protein
MTAEMSSPAIAPAHASGLKDTLSDGDSKGSVENESNEKDFTLSRRGVLVFVTLAVLELMAALDGTSLSVALPVWTSLLFTIEGNFQLTRSQIIAQSQNGSAIEAFWSGTAFLLSSTGTQSLDSFLGAENV